MYNIDNIIIKIKKTVASHRLDKPGAYTRWLWQNEAGTRELGLNEYGCADAANILYTIGEFPSDPEERASWVEILQNMQDEKTGLFTEATHHYIHTTAHCSAALELFDAKPKYPYHDLEIYKKKNALYNLLDNLGWNDNPWRDSHQGAGVYAAFANAGQVTPEWKKWYFDWFWENADETTGFWKKGCGFNRPMFFYMAGGFHYFFNHEHAHMPMRYPDKIIDSTLEMYYDNSISYDNIQFGTKAGFIEIDWIYCLTRSMRQTTHRFEECKKALLEFTDTFIKFLNEVDETTHDGFNDLHSLFGTVCALAELQQALPGHLISEKPLKLVLDRRPFI